MTIIIKGRLFLMILFIVVSAFSTSAQQAPYWKEIQAFQHQDSISAPPKKAILFVGSSSFRLWNDVQKDFPKHIIINRGFGGSSLPDVIRYADDIILPYSAKQVVIYCGENDLASSESVTAEIVFNRFVTLFEIIRKKKANTRIAFVSIKPSPSRSKIQSKVIDANKMMKPF
jgi:hypothetical protein